LSDSSDLELIARAREGDRSAYALLFERRQASGLRFAEGLVGEPRAGDLANEAFAEILEQLDRGVGPTSNFSSYLLTAIRNVHIDELRRNSREWSTDDFADVPSSLVTIADGADERAERSAVIRAFRSLPDSWRQALWYAEVAEEPLEQVAARLGSNANAVGVLCFRARQGLREAYVAEHAANAVNPDCWPFAPLIPKYVRGGLRGRRANAFVEHLDGCSFCHGAVLDVRAINNNLSAVLAPAAAPVMVAAAHAASTASTVSRTTLWKILTGVAATAGAAAAVATLLNHPAPAAAPERRAVDPPTSAPTHPVPEPTRPAPTPRPSSPPPPTVSITPKPSPSPRGGVPSAPSPQASPASVPVWLDPPRTSTLRTGEITTARVLISAGPANEALSLTIEVSSGNSFSVTAGADDWSCAHTDTGSGFRVVCRSKPSSSKQVNLGFSVTVTDQTQAMTGQLTVNGRSGTAARGIRINPS